MIKPRLFCFGLGYTALRLALYLLSKGWEVAGTVRDKKRVKEIENLGIEALLFDRGCPLENPAAKMMSASHLLSSVPPDQYGDTVLDTHGKNISDLCNTFKWIGYLSTTGVYGNRNGDTVKEGDVLEPTSVRASRRVDAESRWLELNAHIFRIAGIYGPKRCVLDDVRQRRAKRIDKPGQVFSRIHVDDLVRILATSMATPNSGQIYNVCDDEPAPPIQVVTFACELLGIKPPLVQSFEEAKKEMSPMALTFWGDNKRVNNRRIKEDLGVKLLYPDYRQGLRAILEGGD
ncbi:MAG: NAD(P)-dependent oxidoreductase [Magnetovibrio sp.]|nr:NAD(P)-dependent oxidoreductase [Magnetovibrio sp.]|tara:strand:+ start:3194 stop:4060 length:867 start_codon:yes stop_codon:yes gene_type:complete